MTELMKKKYFSILPLINQKKLGKTLTSENIHQFIQQLVDDSIPDYQVSALLMAIYLQGLNAKETVSLTQAMLNSGVKLDFGNKEYVDKHSTGGVGDKTSFIVGPLAASLGVKVPMIAGRSLGHTGGTIDKIESISGYRTDLSLQEFQQQVREHSFALIGQTSEIAPADKILYRLRDVTGTIESIPLICASILSKKIASGVKGIVFDIKYGSGAFMQSKKDAKLLAHWLKKIAESNGLNCSYCITFMGQPLGQYAGNALEIEECLAVFDGKGPKDLTDLCLELSARMVLLAGKAKNLKAALKACKASLQSGAPKKLFLETIKRQGGDFSTFKSTDGNIQSLVITAAKNGWLKEIDCRELGLLINHLGGGRFTKTDTIDPYVGFKLLKKIGDKVHKGEAIIEIYHRAGHQAFLENWKKELFLKIFRFSSKKVIPPKLILETYLGKNNA